MIVYSQSDMTRRQQLAQQTKSALLESALKLFHDRGFDATTVEDITDKAGVAKGTFYTYFATKSDIIVEWFWTIDRYYNKYSSANLKRYDTARDKLLAFTRAQMRYVRDVVGNMNLKILYANQAIQPGSEKIIINQKRAWHRIIRDTIQEGQDNGEFRTDLPAERMAVLFNRSARGVFLDWCISDASYDLAKEGVEFMRDWIMAALENEPRAPGDNASRFPRGRDR